VGEKADVFVLHDGSPVGAGVGGVVNGINVIRTARCGGDASGEGRVGGKGTEDVYTYESGVFALREEPTLNLDKFDWS
jgi:hypothetical protein